MEKSKQQSTKPKDPPEVIVKKSSDLKLRVVSSIFLLIFIIVYIGLSVIYTETTLANKEIAAWFNYVFTFVLIGFSMYELMNVLQIGMGRDQAYLKAIGIFMGLVLFVFPIDGSTNQPLYAYMHLDEWLRWYVIVLVLLVLGIGLVVLGYLTTSSVQSGFLLLIYTFIITLGFRGFSLIALSLDPLNNNRPLFGFNTIIFIWGTIILTDMFAYIGGRKAGKHPMAPTISPKKTWEGALIGTAVAVAVATIYGTAFYYFLPNFAPFLTLMTRLGDAWVGLPGIIIFLFALLNSIVGQLGDLMFSLLKRLYEIKDYSRLIPGHGGVLDRFDSFLAVFAVMYFVSLFV